MTTQKDLYEVQGYANGKWRFLGTYDDSLTAQAQTIRIRKLKKYLAVRVVSERYDDRSGQYFTRTLYQYSAVESSRAAR